MAVEWERYRLKDFAYVFSLQVGVVFVCCFGLVLSVLAFLKLCYNPMVEEDPNVAVGSHLIAIVFILASLLVYVLGLAGSALENSRMLRISGTVLICLAIYWTMLTALSFSKNCNITRYVCVDNRCTERFYVQNGYWRQPVVLCGKNQSSPQEDFNDDGRQANATPTDLAEPNKSSTTHRLNTMKSTEADELVINVNTWKEEEEEEEEEEHPDTGHTPTGEQDEERGTEEMGENDDLDKKPTEEGPLEPVEKHEEKENVDSEKKPEQELVEPSEKYEIEKTVDLEEKSTDREHTEPWKKPEQKETVDQGKDSNQEDDPKLGNEVLSQRGERQAPLLIDEEIMKNDGTQLYNANATLDGKGRFVAIEISGDKLSNGSQPAGRNRKTLTRKTGGKPKTDPELTNGAVNRKGIVEKETEVSDQSEKDGEPGTGGGGKDFSETKLKPPSTARVPDENVTSHSHRALNESITELAFDPEWTPIGKIGSNAHLALSIVYALLILPLWYLYPIWMIFSLASQIDLDEVV